MSRKKILLMVLLVSLVLLSTVSGVIWNLRHYVMVDFQFYPRDVQQLDLRDQEISQEDYKKFIRRLPGCEILWNVPFQDTRIPWDATEITVSSLTQEDIRDLAYLKQLKTVKAEHCTDYENLLQLYQQRPDLQVKYTVMMESETYVAGARRVTLETAAPETVALLRYFPELQSVLCSGGASEDLLQLKEYCQEYGLDLLIFLGGKIISQDIKTLTADAVTEAQIGLLQLLPQIQKVHIRNPEVSAQALRALQQSRPDVTITWEQQICGQLFSSTVEELDLSGVKLTSLEDLARELAYFPNLKQVFLGECGLDNASLASLRDQVREQYKLVWVVSCGNKLKTRTDATTFMPLRDNVYYFNDEEAYNLRYCEDMVCIDIGHMSIHNIDFVEYMPNLEYLILAHTQVQYIEPISTCKKLKFLELDWTPIRDLNPLKGCTALEDLNLGNTFADFTPVEEMTWLNNLWMVDCSADARSQMTQALPNTKVMITGAATVANGWRNLENYYQMRDLLGMHYMSW